MNTQEEWFKYVSGTAKIFYEKYKYYYIKHAISLEDLMQEAKITALKVLADYKGKPPEEMKKIINVAVRRRMSRMRNNSLGDFENIVTIDDSKFEQEDSSEIATEDEILDTINSTKQKSEKANSLLSELREVCTNEEFDIVYKIYYEGKTMEEVGREYGLGKSRISQIHKAIMKKLRKDFE